MKFLIRLVVILLAAVAVAIVGLLMLPGERIASIAAQQLSKQTGREVSISPETSISLYPVLGVTTGPARIGTADWAKNGPLLTTESLAIGVDIPALIGGTIRLTHIEAKSPNVVLERRADGRGNWELTPNTAPEAVPADAPQSAAQADAGQQFDLALDKALITDASLRFIDHGTGTDQSFEDVDLELSWPDMGGAADLKLGATPFGERIELSATLADVMGLARGEQVALSGALDAAGARLAVEGVASIAGMAAVQLDATIPEAGTLLRALGQDPASFGLAPNFNPNAAIKTQASFDGTRLALRQMEALLDGSRIAGDADVVLEAGAPQITAKLDADIKGAGALMRMAGQAPESFGLDPAFNADLSSKITLSMAGAVIDASLSDLNARIEDTTASGSAKIRLQDSVPNVDANLALNLPNAARTAALLGQPLSNFGLSASAVPSVRSNLVATIRGDAITAKLSDLAASVGGASLSGALDIALSGGAPAVSGAINANVPSTAALMTALGQAAPDLPRGFGQAIKASTTLAFRNNRLDLSGLSVTLDQNALSGSVSVGLGGSVPSISANLSAGALDFSALAPDDSAASGSGSGPSGWPKDRIDASALSLINGDIRLKAASLDLGILQFGATDLGVSIDNARAVFSINDLAAYQGRVSGQFVANNRSGLSVGGDLNANAIALNPLLRALADIDKISGPASVNLNFLGVGNSVDAIMRSLSGQIAMSVPQGDIAGIDLEGLIRQGNANASKTPFSNLKATGAINGGVLRNSDLTAVTGRVDAKGEGYIDLGNQTLDYLITPIAKEVGNTGKIEIPVRIKGPWSSPTIRPDLEAALNLENERKKLEEQARQELEREKEKLRQQAEEEKAKLRAKAEAEAKKLEDKARAKAEAAARKAAEQAAKALKLDQERQKQLENATKNALENEVKKGLKNLLGGN